MTWLVTLQQGFTDLQRHVAAQGRFRSSGAAYDYVLLHFFQQERRLYSEEITKDERGMPVKFTYKGVNDDGFSASVQISERVGTE